VKTLENGFGGRKNQIQLLQYISPSYINHLCQVTFINLIAKLNLEVEEQTAVQKGRDCVKSWSAAHKWRSVAHWGFPPSVNLNRHDTNRGRDTLGMLRGAYTQKPDFSQNLQPIACNPLNLPGGVNLSVFHPFLC